MAAPEYVPTDAVADEKVYRGPLRPKGSWTADRPADLGPGQPRGTRLGAPGPDQGFALTIAERFGDQLRLADGEHAADAVAGAAAIASRRASLFGRAPVVHDVTVAFTLWGFLDDAADAELVELRKQVFAEVAHHHHYVARRAIADAVPDRVLTMTPDEVANEHRADWRALLDRDVLPV
ncbi:MAG: hypothetical protein AAGK32_13135 [Actinomycetota bacterium]